MEGAKPGQRLLLALASSVSDDAASEPAGSIYNLSSIFIAVGGVLCLVLTLLMCTCKDSKKKTETEEHGLQDVTANEKGGNKALANAKTEATETKVKAAAEPVITNGGPQQSNSSTLPGHSRQASSGSAHNMRPTSLRELPEPPVSPSHVSSMPGVERPSSYARSGGATGGGDHGYRAINSSGVIANGKASTENQVKSNSDGYDHLGPKPSIKPTDYDSLADPESTDGETPISETGGVSESHYSQLRERTYAVVNDVKAKSNLFDPPYSRVKDKDSDGSDFYSQVKDEDPYNHIGESDGAVSSSFIRQLREKKEKEVDPYSLLDGDSGGDWKTALGAVGGVPLNKPPPSAQSPLSNSFPQENHDNVVDEYAVVHKTKSSVSERQEREARRNSDDDMSPFQVPPEPPRLYNVHDEDGEGDTFTVTTPSGRKKEHKYYKVTARESLASMSARNALTALNPYEVVPDVPENTYATVEGGSGDGVVTRAMATGGNEENRLSQGSDTYAEIAISGGGLSTSVISTSSSTGGNNNSSSSGAPVPPSLDSLHLMTKSQTSSEGDRLSDRMSDRHLASPEDSGLGLNQWGDKLNPDDSGASSEDGYSTLKRTEGSLPHDHTLPDIPGQFMDQDSGEVTLVPNYQTVKDSISDNHLMEEVENDPNYESVDETRAKVAALKARDSSSLGSQFSSKSGGAGNHISVVKVLRAGKQSEYLPGKPPGNEAQASNGNMRRRRPEHDYEEVDISPPLSPSNTSSNRIPTTPTNRIPTTAPSTNSPPFMSSPPLSSSPTTHMSHSKELEKAKEKAIQSHMYEELTVVRAKKSEMNKSSSASKGSSKSDSEDKKKSGSNDKKKNSSEDKRKSDEKRKSNSEDKKKGASDEKKKHGHEDKRKSGLDGTRL